MKRLPVKDQPLVIDADGVVRFQENRLVRMLLDFATPRGMGLNELAMVDVSDRERQQLAQLIGYSVSGYGELNYVPPGRAGTLDAKAEKLAAKPRPGPKP